MAGGPSGHAPRPEERAFAKQRAALLELLEALPRSGWSRAATVTGAGRPLERTVLEYADRVAAHERPHLRQLAEIVERSSLKVTPWAGTD